MSPDLVLTKGIIIVLIKSLGRYPCEITYVKKIYSSIVMRLSACIKCSAGSPSLPHALPDFSLSIALCTMQNVICVTVITQIPSIVYTENVRIL